MGRQVVFAPRATRDLEAIVRYISLNDPQAALRFGTALVERAEAAGAFPESGRMVPEFGNPRIREVFHGSYRIVYRLPANANVIEIARFWHAAQGAPEL
jgi:plasmid stabilization system protein ParE